MKKKGTLTIECGSSECNSQMLRLTFKDLQPDDLANLGVNVMRDAGGHILFLIGRQPFTFTPMQEPRLKFFEDHQDKLPNAAGACIVRQFKSKAQLFPDVVAKLQSTKSILEKCMHEQPDSVVIQNQIKCALDSVTKFADVVPNEAKKIGVTA